MVTMVPCQGAPWSDVFRGACAPGCCTGPEWAEENYEEGEERQCRSRLTTTWPSDWRNAPDASGHLWTRWHGAPDWSCWIWRRLDPEALADLRAHPSLYAAYAPGGGSDVLVVGLYDEVRVHRRHAGGGHREDAAQAVVRHHVSREAVRLADQARRAAIYTALVAEEYADDTGAGIAAEIAMQSSVLLAGGIAEATRDLRAGDPCPRCGRPLLACSPSGRGTAACDECHSVWGE